MLKTFLLASLIKCYFFAELMYHSLKFDTQAGKLFSLPAIHFVRANSEEHVVIDEVDAADGTVGHVVT